jgi:hypothetical protein
MWVKIPTKDMRKTFLRVLKILGVNERFGLGRVLDDIPYVHSKLGFICLGYPLGIFIIDEMSESAYQCV